MDKYAEVIFGLPLKKSFDYAIPDSLMKDAEIGKRVYVPFGKRKVVGYCIGKSKKSKSSYTKEIISVLDKEILFTKKILFFLKTLSEHYFASWGEMMALATPAYLRRPKKTLVLEEKPQTLSKERIFTKFSPEAERMINLIKEKENFNFLIFEDYFQEKRLNIYYEICEWVLNEGKSVLIIVPEIYIADNLYSVLKRKFDSYEIILYHSGFSEKDGFINWCKIRGKYPKVVIGTRMAVFLPQENFGLIIVEDESSTFHKQDEFPFFNARDVAICRANYFKIPLILVGIPPLVETYYKAKKDGFWLIDLRNKPERYPNVSVIDLSSGRRSKNYITKPLEIKINEVLEKGNKVFLVLNRRGFATFIRCRKCGRVMRCERCERNFIYHFSIKKLVCHYCGAVQEAPSLCPNCQTSYLRYQGIGTEKLESELSRLFPRAKTARIDLDIKREKVLKNVLKDFQEKRIDILTGTNMLVKLPPLSGIGLVGIVNLEEDVKFPDFRGGERIFSLLIRFLSLLKQDNEWGELLIQTRNPQNNLFDALKKLDYEMFYQDELSLRKELGLPPFKNLIVLNLRGKNQKNVEKNAHLLARSIKEMNTSRGIFISDAIPHPVLKLRDKYRWQIFIKSGNIKNVFALLDKVFKKQRKFKGNVLTIDIEPK
ncbi:MAG: primosomal protein N' [Candidatus Omnitrophica bacterium]|nr:primosomal protein N' [Candidatus Omnitrophota bacterium]